MLSIVSDMKLIEKLQDSITDEHRLGSADVQLIKRLLDVITLPMDDSDYIYKQARKDRIDDDTIARISNPVCREYEILKGKGIGGKTLSHILEDLRPVVAHYGFRPIPGTHYWSGHSMHENKDLVQVLPHCTPDCSRSS